jgi:hypothetical protein
MDEEGFETTWNLAIERWPVMFIKPGRRWDRNQFHQPGAPRSSQRVNSVALVC